MKRMSFIVLIAALFFISAKKPLVSAFRDGDIIFQSSMSGQSYAVQLATHSEYSHCGLMFLDNGKWMVYEATQPVRKTILTDWIRYGDDKKFVVKRLKNADSVLVDSVIVKMRYAANRRMGRDYDPYFNWDEERIYCSELVWKCYKEATGIGIGERRPLGNYDLSSPVVKKILRERYGDSIPADELMISPGEIFDSPLLIVVEEK